MTDLFPNALHVARREYLVRVKSRAFVITTVILALAIIGVTLLPTVLDATGVAGGPPKIAVRQEATNLPVDPTAVLRQSLGEAAGPDDGGERPTVTPVNDAVAAADAVRAGEYDGLLTITRGPNGDLAFEYLTNDSPTDLTRLLVTQAASFIAQSDRLGRAGISPSQSAAIFSPPSFSISRADDAGGEETEFGAGLLLAYVVVILTFMAIITYGMWVAQSVAEEKSNRVMELLITAATPRQLLTGKVLGTGAAGLTQYLVIVAALLIGLAINTPVAELLGASGGLTFDLPAVEPWMLPALSLLFILGFILYCTLYAAAGSMVSRIEDVQQASGTLMFVSMGGYFASFAALNDAGAGWVAALSYIPFFSPYLIPARMLLTDVPPMDVVIAVLLLVVTLVAAIWVAARIYSAGVLLYGQRVGVRTVLRATRVAR